jgi:phage tail-like protein
MNPPVRATEANYYDSYAYEVVVDGFVKAAFSKCTGLTGTAEEIAYAEGGAMTDNKSPGRVSFADITLERGETDNDEMYGWWKEICDARTGSGAWRESDYKRDVVIRQKTRDGTVVRRWQVFSAWPKEFGVSDWDNTSSEKHIEHIVLAHEGFEPLR